MTQEPTRKCGHRKVGGMYIVSDPGAHISCVVLPYNVESCPCCFEGIKFSRSFKWFIPNKLFKNVEDDCISCSMGTSCPIVTDEKSGLMWVGERFYTPENFIEESTKYGISKRISSVPRKFEVGKTWIFLAHNGAGRNPINRKVPGIFCVFKPTRIEKIVTYSQFKNKEEMDKLILRGITPIPVHDDDYDHRGSVYDRIHNKSLFL